MAAQKKNLEAFEAQATEELTGLHDEIERAEKARNSAQLLAAASQRNLDSLAASLKSMEDELAGGADPRHRKIPPHSTDAPKDAETGKAEPVKRGSGARPRTPNKVATGKASPRPPGQPAGGAKNRPGSGGRKSVKS